MSPEQTRTLHARVGVAYRALLDDAWKRGMQQVVICDGEIAYETRSDGIISKIVQQIATERDRSCYTFSAPDVAEESGWNEVREDDYYPTIDVSLGPIGPEENPNMSGFISVKADFDTGNQGNQTFQRRPGRWSTGSLHSPGLGTCSRTIWRLSIYPERGHAVYPR